MVEELQLQSTQVELAAGKRQHAGAAVTAGDHHEPGALAGDGRSSLGHHALEAPHRAHQEDVAPAAADERGNSDIDPFFVDVNPGPVIVVIRMIEPVVVIRRQRAEFVEALERRFRRPVRQDFALPFLTVIVRRFQRFFG